MRCKNPDAFALPVIVLALLATQYIPAFPAAWQFDRIHSTLIMSRDIVDSTCGIGSDWIKAAIAASFPGAGFAATNGTTWKSGPHRATDLSRWALPSQRSVLRGNNRESVLLSLFNCE